MQISHYLALVTGLSLWLALPRAEDENGEHISHREIVVALGQDVHLATNEESRNLVVIGGSAIVDGKVDQDAVVIFGKSKINGRVGGNLVSVFSQTDVGPKANIERESVLIGGHCRLDPKAKLGRHRTEFLLGGNLPDFQWVWDWVVHGVLWARPLPPQVPWVWLIAGMLIGLYLLCAVLFPRAIQKCVSGLGNRPIGSFFAGLLGFALIGPIIFLLVISVAGVLIVPFVLMALAAAVFLGKVAVYEFTGAQLSGQVTGKGISSPVLALMVGFILFYLLYMVPVLGFLVWGLATVWGLGAVLVAAFSGLRREHAPVSAPRPAPPPPAAPSIAGAGGPAASEQFASSAAAPSEPAPVQPVPPALAAAGAPGAIAEAAAYARAGFWIRLIAAALDALIFVVLLRALSLHLFERFGLVLWLAYNVGMWTWKGTTLGGIVFGLKIVRLDGRVFDFPLALVRGLASVLSALVLGLGFCWAGWDAEKQSWHDKIAGTVIVKVPKGMTLL